MCPEECTKKKNSMHPKAIPGTMPLNSSVQFKQKAELKFIFDSAFLLIYNDITLTALFLRISQKGFSKEILLYTTKCQKSILIHTSFSLCAQLFNLGNGY